VEQKRIVYNSEQVVSDVFSEAIPSSAMPNSTPPISLVKAIAMSPPTMKVPAAPDPMTELTSNFPKLPCVCNLRLNLQGRLAKLL